MAVRQKSQFLNDAFQCTYLIPDITHIHENMLDQRILSNTIHLQYVCAK